MRLTGESDQVRRESLRAIAALPGIDGILIHEVAHGAKRALALDAISGLRRVSLLEPLMRLGRTDADGSIHLALGTLVTEQNRKALARYFLSQLRRVPYRDSLSPVAGMVILDTLGRWKVEIPDLALRRLLHHHFYEIRESAVTYCQRMALVTGAGKYMDLLIRETLKGRPFQVRLRAASALMTLESRLRKKENREAISSVLKECARGEWKEVRDLCNRYSGQLQKRKK